MFNKLSSLQVESLYPVCFPLSLDGDEYNEEIVNQTNSSNIDIKSNLKDLVLFKKLLEKMCNGTLSTQDEEELLRIEKVLSSTNDIVRNTALNPLIASFAEIIESAPTPVWLKQIRLRVVPENNMPFGNSKPDCSYSKQEFPTEYFGYYDSYSEEIVLCPERISKAPAELEKQHRHISSRELYVVVLVHALAHALMDPTKAEGKSAHFQPIITTNGFSEREESIPTAHQDGKWVLEERSADGGVLGEYDHASVF